MMPSANRIGRPHKTDLREVVNALLYLASSGGAWRLLPKDFPPFSMVQKYFYRWREEGLLRSISNSLVMAAREAEGREASPTAGVIDSQSVKTTESGGIRGLDAGKKINGRKRHIVVDTIGLMVGRVVHAADIQDRDGVPATLNTTLERWPWLRHVFADGGLCRTEAQGRDAKDRHVHPGDRQEDGQAKRFEALPRRWVVERTFAWLGRCRRLAKDWEKSIASAEAWIYVDRIRLLTRRLTRA